MREDVLALRVAARFIQADTLTKQWLMGVKRGWAAVIKSPHEMYDKHRILVEFLKNFGEQILLKRHGINITFTGSKARNKFEALLAKTREEVDQCEVTYDKVAGEYRYYSGEREKFLDKIEEETGDNIRNMKGAEEFIKKYPDYKNLHHFWVKAMDAVDQYRWHPEVIWAPANKTFDAMMKFLYSEAKETAEYLTKDYGRDLINDSYATVDKEYDLNGAKIIIVDDSIDRIDIRNYVKLIDKAQQLLKSKGFGKLWYGVMFVESKNHTKTPDELELAAKWGYSSSGNAGEYDSNRDQVYIKNPPKSYVTTIVIHELGHRYWYKFMTSAQRARFNSLIQTKTTDKYRDYPQGPTDEEGNLKPVAPLGEYANSNIEEAFAEVFEGYVSESELTRDQLESFRSVLSSVEEPLVDATPQ
jgi:hypothetical protein